MPEYQSNDGGGQRRRRRGGRNRQGSRQGGNYTFTPNSSKKNAQPTGFQKFLSIISFGLLGKSSSKPQPKPAAPQRQDRPEQSQRRSPQGGESKPIREPRPAPSATEITTERLYVGNLSYDATESDLFELFNGVGKVQNAEVVVNSRTQRSKGFAFVTMAGVEEAKRAVAELHGKEFMGRALQLSGAKPPPARGDRDRGDSSEAAEEPAEASV